ncbi:MAG: Gfo/Idh/MocA family oxidoreductase [Planctomycetota bacterium]|nr:Gfo/Idh/MocA family oxidoreductase [Planctomycetota bacterium]
MKLRVGLVGLGRAWENRYRTALLSLADRFQVQAVCTPVSVRAEQVARELGATVIDGYRAMSIRSDIDAILMLAPDWYGPLPILAACEAGKAIYCAAALDIDPQRAIEVREKVDLSGVAFMAEFARRHAPATLRLKELIATRLGPPRLLFCHDRLQISDKQKQRYGLPHPSVTRDLIELVDWCSWVVGSRPVSVIGTNRKQSTDGKDDYRALSLDFAAPTESGEGPLAQISCGRYLSPKWPEAVGFRPPAQLQVCCENGAAFIDLPSTLVWYDEAGRHMESLEMDRPVGEQLLTQFHRAVTSLVRRTQDLDDAYAALQVVMAAQDSHADGRRVIVN